MLWRRNAKGYDIALDICRAIHFLHSHNVIHSDIKSSNILLDRSRSTAKIAECVTPFASPVLCRCSAATGNNKASFKCSCSDVIGSCA